MAWSSIYRERRYVRTLTKRTRELSGCSRHVTSLDLKRGKRLISYERSSSPLERPICIYSAQWVSKIVKRDEINNVPIHSSTSGDPSIGIISMRTSTRALSHFTTICLWHLLVHTSTARCIVAVLLYQVLEMGVEKENGWTASRASCIWRWFCQNSSTAWQVWCLTQDILSSLTPMSSLLIGRWHLATTVYHIVLLTSLSIIKMTDLKLFFVTQ